MEDRDVVTYNSFMRRAIVNVEMINIAAWRER
jgi:hypothetical protein